MTLHTLRPQTFNVFCAFLPPACSHNCFVREWCVSAYNITQTCRHHAEMKSHPTAFTKQQKTHTRPRVDDDMARSQTCGVHCAACVAHTIMGTHTHSHTRVYREDDGIKYGSFLHKKTSGRNGRCEGRQRMKMIVSNYISGRAPANSLSSQLFDCIIHTISRPSLCETLFLLASTQIYTC